MSDFDQQIPAIEAGDLLELIEAGVVEDGQNDNERAKETSLSRSNTRF